jgi:hypothetical protein
MNALDLLAEVDLLRSTAVKAASYVSTLPVVTFRVFNDTVFVLRPALDRSEFVLLDIWWRVNELVDRISRSTIVSKDILVWATKANSLLHNNWVEQIEAVAWPLKLCVACSLQ